MKDTSCHVACLLAFRHKPHESMICMLIAAQRRVNLGCFRTSKHGKPAAVPVQIGYHKIFVMPSKIPSSLPHYIHQSLLRKQLGVRYESTITM
ncbi:hypothetical protein KEM48_013455 [Puccinia striiformis f. sp. tritici PST-130]|nr:hypothetical protein KEM48_013455 [Puccinia striiformis f. sp. tritici PST-130]